MAANTVNMDRMHAFLGKVVGDFGAMMSAPLVMIGDRLGLYQALAAAGTGGMTSAQLAEKTHTNERYVREWLMNQASGGYIEYDAKAAKFWMSPEQTAALADDASPFNVTGGFYVAASAMRDVAKVERVFASGGGLGWGEHDPDLYCGTARFFGATYAGQLVSQWLPALEGVTPKLERGATVADVGCGHGISTMLMAKAFPNSKFIGFDSHAPSIDCANAEAQRAGVADRCRFQAASSTEYPSHAHGYDLITFFDCLHDMGDPVGAAAHARKSLKPDGTAMVVEPMAGDKVEDNFNPIGRVFSAASTMICVPASLASQGPALGAQAGEARLRKVMMEGGFSKFRRAMGTPFNLILEARA